VSVEDPTQYPIKYAAYPRGPRPYGSPDHLKAVAEIYYGLNTAGLIAFMFGLAVPAFADAIGHASMPLLVAFVVFTCVGTGLGVYPHLKKKGKLSGWWDGTSVVMAVLIGLLSPFCLGFFIIALIQSWATQELRKYGLGRGFFGATREEIAR
jgi:hypothetical protein